VATLGRRNRCVIFRVTEQEYDCLKSACDAAGTHSLSDYARTKLLIGTKAKSREDRILGRFLKMDQMLTDVYQLTRQVFESIHGQIEPLGVRDRPDNFDSPAASRTGVESSESTDQTETSGGAGKKRNEN